MSLYGGTPPPITDRSPRCWRCSKLLAYFVTRPWKLMCGRCKAVNGHGDEPVTEEPPTLPLSDPTAL